jgi:hypothetical protein
MSICRMEKFWGSIAGMRKSKGDETIQEESG